MGPSPARAATAKPYMPAVHAEVGSTRTPLEMGDFREIPLPLLGLVCFVSWFWFCLCLFTVAVMTVLFAF